MVQLIYTQIKETASCQQNHQARAESAPSRVIRRIGYHRSHRQSIWHRLRNICQYRYRYRPENTFACLVSVGNQWAEPARYSDLAVKHPLPYKDGILEDSITNGIKRMTETTVTFAVKDYKEQGHWKEISISGKKFIRKFLTHIPPKRFVQIRQYGLLSSRNKNRKIILCRNLLGCKKYISRFKGLNAPAIFR